MKQLDIHPPTGAGTSTIPDGEHRVLFFQWLRILGLVLVFHATNVVAEEVCSQGVMCFETIQTGDRTEFFAINKRPLVALSVAVKLDLENLNVVEGVNRRFVLQGGEKRKLFTLEPAGDGDWRYEYNYFWVYGDFQAEHDVTQRYRPPYRSGKTYAVSQTCHGSFSHTGGEQFAVDFDMPEGTPVAAACAGTVVDIKQDSNRGGADREFEYDANHVLVRHADHTLGFYFHLQHNSARVRVGQQVQAGEVLALSGNTGFSTGPHLHFEVTQARYVADDEEPVLAQSVPISFSSKKSVITCPPDGTRMNVKR